MLPSPTLDSTHASASLRASTALVTASAPWHPAFVAEAGAIPRFEAIESPTSPESHEIRITPEAYQEALPSGYRTQAADSGAVWRIAGESREEALASWLSPIREAKPNLPADDPVVADFLALGTTTWLLESVANLMGHPSALDRLALEREVVAGAQSWLDGDCATAIGRLRAAFELLTQAREKFYPVDDYAIDVLLLDASLPASSLTPTLDARVPFTLLASGRALDALAETDPVAMSRLRDAISEDWVDVVGGPYDEIDEGCLPLESVLWQYRRGAEAYARHLDGRSIETWARRRFGLHPMVPQLARRHGMRYAWHVGFDQGRFPIPAETKRLWESPDGSTLETLFRPPLAADRPETFLTLSATLARSLKSDHVAALPFARWPSPVAPWFSDLRRSAAFSPVLARWVTLGRFFELSDRPWDLFRATLDDYHPAYFGDALRAASKSPLSGSARHARLRARLDGLATLHACTTAFVALAQGMSRPVLTPDELPAFDSTAPPLDSVETALEAGRFEEAETRLADSATEIANATAEHLATQPDNSGIPSDHAACPGYLVLNPLGWSRRAVAVLPDTPLDQQPVGPLRAAQFTEDGVVGVVDLPAFGFVWIPRQTTAETAAPRPPGVHVSGQRLSNEWIEAEFDERTGGLRSIRRPGEPTARLAQQLVATGFDDEGTVMSASSIDIDYAGPALAQIVSRGQIHRPASPDRPIARFRQTARVWSGRPILELFIEFEEIDPALAIEAKPKGATPALVCRWAWADTSATVQRSWLFNLEPTRAIDADTPEGILIDSRQQHSALLFGGLYRHRRHGGRMLDTWLVAGHESARRFELGVVLDLEQPARALGDWLAPPVVVPLDHPPPPGRESGWFFKLDHRAVAVTRVAFAPFTADGRGWGLTFHLIETAGQAARCRLRLFRDPLGARLVDFQGDLIMDVPVQGDAVQVDLTPRELACVEVTLGLY